MHEETCRLSAPYWEGCCGTCMPAGTAFGQLLLCIPGEGTFLEESLQKEEVSIPSRILGDSRPGEATREGTVTPHYFISHDVQERGSSNLASRAFNAQAAVRRPHLGRCEMTLTGMVHWCPFLRGGTCRRHTWPRPLQSTQLGYHVCQVPPPSTPVGSPIQGLEGLLSIRPLPFLWLRAPEALQFGWTMLQQDWGGPRGLQACPVKFCLPVNIDPRNKAEDACEGNGWTNK